MSRLNDEYSPPSVRPFQVPFSYDLSAKWTDLRQRVIVTPLTQSLGVSRRRRHRTTGDVPNKLHTDRLQPKSSYVSSVRDCRFSPIKLLLTYSFLNLNHNNPKTLLTKIGYHLFIRLIYSYVSLVEKLSKCIITTLQSINIIFREF